MLDVTALAKAYVARGAQPVPAVDDLSFSVGEGEFFSILGSSGCGKTTVLRAIAGLETPDGGTISIAGRTMFSSAGRINVPPHKRDVSLMFQSYAIWPHMSVFENVAFPLRARKASGIEPRVREMLATVRLSETADRPASRLSGGQQQRLALARALVANPRLLLLDEPLSNLDVKLRVELRLELKRIQRIYRTTTLYVTHDQAEALSLSDRLAVMEKGRFVQVGTPRQIYKHPATRAVAEFIGQSNAVRGRAVAGAGANTAGRRFDTPLGIIDVEGAGPTAESGEVTLSFRPESVRVARPAHTYSTPNAFAGKVALVMYYGDHEDLHIDVGGTIVLARAPGSLEIAVGDAVSVAVDPKDVAIIE